MQLLAHSPPLSGMGGESEKGKTLELRWSILIIIIIIILFYKMGEREVNKTQAKQVMHHIIAHYPLADAQPIPEQWSSPSRVYELSPVHILSVTFYCMKYPFGWFGPAVPAMLPPSQLPVHLLTGRAPETEKSLTQGKHYLATIETSMC